MIEVSKLNGQAVLVNPDLIRTIESAPDTVLIFSDGERLIVRDVPQDIVTKIVRFRRECGMPRIVKE